MVCIPIYFQGFGEEVLAKPTPDETDEPLNRRALYILSASNRRRVPTCLVQSGESSSPHWGT